MAPRTGLSQAAAASHGEFSHEEWLVWVKKRLMAYDPLEAGLKRYGLIWLVVTSWEYRD